MIYFREVKEPHLKESEEMATAWHVECYSDEGTQFPVGIAFVTEIIGKQAQLNFIFVADQWRRQGFAMEILTAVKDRWPNFVSTSPMGEDSAALGRKFGINQDVDLDE